MNRSYVTFIFVVCLVANVVTMSCKKDKKTTPPDINADTVVTLTPYSIIYPAHFPQAFTPDDNRPSVERIQLGRMLYYDPILSNDGRACAGCHFQSYGFTIPGMVNNMPVLPHVNLAWHKNFMWDGSKSGTLEDVMLFETKEFFATDLGKMNSNSKYKALFKKYFGVDNITHKEIAYALAQFTRTMISGNTKYDRYFRGVEKFTYDEQKGWEIFFTEKGDCFHCHVTLVTTDNLFHNTGLNSNYSTEVDKGYYNVTKDLNDIGKFRTPNLRNVALRKHFMHDGRFSTLEEVVDFYDHGTQQSATLDPIMTKPAKIGGLKLSEKEKQQLVAFLNTLTDSTFLTNKEFSKPD